MNIVVYTDRAVSTFAFNPLTTEFVVERPRTKLRILRSRDRARDRPHAHGRGE